MPQVVFTTKTEYLYQAIRKKIVSGEWPQGLNVVISKVAEEFNVSAIPVREALRRLDSEGLIQITPHKGAHVASLDRKKVEEIYAIRTLLEGYATSTAANFIDAETLDSLKAMMDDMDALAEAKDTERYGEKNKEFHRSIYRCSPYPMLYDMIFNLWDSENWSRVVFAFYPDRMDRSNDDHRRIVEAIEKKEVDRLELLVREHKRETAELLHEIALKKQQT